MVEPGTRGPGGKQGFSCMSTIIDKKTFTPQCMATGIGSLPHLRVEEAAEAIMSSLREAPFWPQLPNRSYLENMYAQYAEQFPGLIMDIPGKQMFVDAESPAFPEQLEAFYARIIADDVEYFAMSKTYAPGLWEVPPLWRKARLPVKIVKGQVTGPVSFGLTVTTADKKSIIYDQTLADVLVKHLAMKARWQEDFLQRLFPDQLVMMFFDEPYMVSFGTAFCSLSRETVVAMLDEAFSVVKGLSGVHCCGNTDWSLLLQTSVDVLNFDAYEYVDNLFLYHEDLHRFIDRGGFLAWGIVPTSEAVLRESTVSLFEQFAGQIAKLESMGFRREAVLAQSFITPSCGCGSLPVAWTEKILRLTDELSTMIRERYGLR
ncbi:MAG: methionine synthase [Deltaproteobacteria bacterium]|nr:MAG: methionine synthase [Deltaproteobacteria bacterium]